ncbi:alpha/beta fold hydrolase [Rubrimonas cliftonensis]|uniref:alpha/beta fold hydrolase n=1 Tax=Rubrimonas cliftonensis TaxID=89524 RepID=UPI0015875EFA|nr:alpha/beta hydrolase [Rubrimonas cliftonensis]
MRRPDGGRLFHRDYSVATPGRVTALCLPGLTRNCRDFGALAARLAPTRRVICPDMRGRGRSDPCATGAYALTDEACDILTLVDALGLERVVVIGTSRGGLQAMLLAAQRPGLVAGAALNDVGPMLEMDGLKRLVASLAAAPREHPDWDAAETHVRAEFAAIYPTLDAAGWRSLARCLHREIGGRLARDADPALIEATTAALAAAEGAPPLDLWPLFDILTQAPTLALRGGLSDILSAGTLAEMGARGATVVTVPDRGHAPLLDEPAALAAVDALLARVDAAA